MDEKKAAGYEWGDTSSGHPKSDGRLDRKFDELRFRFTNCGDGGGVNYEKVQSVAPSRAQRNARGQASRGVQADGRPNKQCIDKGSQR